MKYYKIVKKGTNKALHYRRGVGGTRFTLSEQRDGYGPYSSVKNELITCRDITEVRRVLRAYLIDKATVTLNDLVIVECERVEKEVGVSPAAPEELIVGGYASFGIIPNTPDSENKLLAMIRMSLQRNYNTEVKSLQIKENEDGTITAYNIQWK